MCIRDRYTEKLLNPEWKAQHGDPQSVGDWMAILNQPDVQDSIKEAIKSEYGDAWGDHIYRITRDIAEQRAISDSRDRPSADVKKETERLERELLLQGGTDELRQQITSSVLPLNEQNKLLHLWASKETQDRRDPAFKDAEERMLAGLRAGTVKGMFSPGSLIKRDALVETEMQNWRERWRSADQEGRKKMAREDIRELVGKLHATGEWKDLLASTHGRNPQTLVDSPYAENLLGIADKAIESMIPEFTAVLNEDNDVVKVPNEGWPLKRRAAVNRFRSLLRQYITKNKLLDGKDPSQITIWGPQIFHDIPDQEMGQMVDRALGAPAIAPGPSTSPEPPSPADEAVTKSQAEGAAMRRAVEGGKNAPFMVVGGKVEPRPELEVADIEKRYRDPNQRQIARTLTRSLDQAHRGEEIASQADFDALYTAQDQTYTFHQLREFQDPHFVRSKAFVPPGITTKLRNNPNYPTQNESDIFWLASRALNLGEQPEGPWYDRDGDWFWAAGVEAAELSPAQARDFLAGHYEAQGLWFEEIIAGKTREGVPLADLGWGDPSDIPWDKMVIGRRDGTIYAKDFKAYWDADKNQTQEGWEETLMGRALLKMSVHPEDVVRNMIKPDGAPQRNIDSFLDRQKELRQLMSAARGREFARSDRWSHEIQRLDSNAPFGHRFLPQDRQYGTHTGLTNYRIFSLPYQKMHERGRAVRAEFEALRNPVKEGK